MDRQYIQENQLVERYLRGTLTGRFVGKLIGKPMGKLTDEEEAAFETYYIADPQTLAELEVAGKLQPRWQDFILDTAGWGKSVIVTPQYAIATSVLRMFSIGLSGMFFRELQQTPVYEGTRIVPVFATRGTSGTPATRLTTDGLDGWVVLLVDPGPEEYGSYRVTINSRTGADPVEIWQVGGLEPGYEELLAVGLPGEMLIPGDYEIRIEGRQAKASGGPDFSEINRLSFRVTLER